MFLGPEEVMKGLQGEIDEMLGKIRISISTLITLRETYDQCRLTMDKYFKVNVLKCSFYFPCVHLKFCFHYNEYNEYSLNRHVQ